MALNMLTISFLREYEDTEKELNTEECQKEINDDEKGLEQLEHELDELGEKVIY